MTPSGQGPDTILRDGADQAGHPVPAGVYVVRGTPEDGPAGTRIVKL